MILKSLKISVKVRKLFRLSSLGAFGVVKRVNHKRTNIAYAIKIV
jgi:hypothetical protein